MDPILLGIYFGKIGIVLFVVTLLAGLVTRAIQVHRAKKAVPADVSGEDGVSAPPIPTPWSVARVIGVTVGCTLIYLVACGVLIWMKTSQPWASSSPKTHEYRVNLPRKATERYVNAMVPSLGKRIVHVYAATVLPEDRHSVKYVVQSFDVLPMIATHLKPDEMLRYEIDSLLGLMEVRTATKHRLTDTPYPAYDIAYERAGQRVRMRFLIKENRIYHMIASPIPPYSDKRIDRDFFDSFQFVTPESE